MGWASGSYLMDDIIESAIAFIPKEDRKDFYIQIIKAMEKQDWDTQTECLEKDEEFDKALKELHPNWF